MGTDTPLPVTPPKKAHSTSNVDPNSLNFSRLNVGDTPTTRKITPHRSSEVYSVEVTRTAVWEDLGGKKGVVPEVEYEFFAQHILPPLHKSIDISSLIEQLKKEGTITDGRWRAFPLDPCKHASDGPDHETENKVFTSLVKVVTAATNSTVTGIKTKKTLHYRSRPDKPPICSFDKKLGRPDGYFVFAPAHTSNEPYWRDLATPAEFKLRDTGDDLQSDITQILWDMYQIMREDPRRRFVFGFTIENTQMRVWMANRSEVVVSEPFNFITDHEKVLHFFLSQMYAPPHRLGIDTTMTVFEERSAGASIYDITVHHVVGGLIEPVVFRTAGLLNDDGAKALRGRGTRIWRVTRLVDGNPDDQADGKVLKDSWIDQDRLQEGEILRQITNDASIDDATREALTKLFLTPVVSGNVIIEEHPDTTRGPNFIDADIPETTVFPLEVVNHKSSHGRTTGTGAKSWSTPQDSTSIVPATSEQRLRILKYSVKQHCRIVYQEECEPLSSQTSLRNVFVSLCLISYGLFAMHTSGWVHRDISTGNILYDTRRNRWVLSDLEYAKRLNTTTSHDVRTGTANFMAIEVDRGGYLFTTEENDEESSDQTPPTNALVAARADRLAALANPDVPHPAGNAGPSKSSRRPKTKPDLSRTFHYNPVHDLESLWWIAVFFLINKETRLAEQPTLPKAVASSSRLSTVPSSEDAPSPRDEDSLPPTATDDRRTLEQVIYARKLFYTDTDRILALCGGATTLEEQIRSLPKYVQYLGECLISLRNALRKHYTAIESAGRDIDRSAREEILVYNQFFNTFEAIVEDLRDQDIIVSPLPVDYDETGIKASRRTAQNSPRPSNQLKHRSGEHESQASGSSQAKKQMISTSTELRRSTRNRNKDRTSV